MIWLTNDKLESVYYVLQEYGGDGGNTRSVTAFVK